MGSVRLLPKNAEMYLFGLHLAASLGFRRYIRHVGLFPSYVPERARVVVFTAFSGSARVRTARTSLPFVCRPYPA
jgi:hypothetical protein